MILSPTAQRRLARARAKMAAEECELDKKRPIYNANIAELKQIVEDLTENKYEKEEKQVSLPSENEEDMESSRMSSRMSPKISRIIELAKFNLDVFSCSETVYLLIRLDDSIVNMWLVDNFFMRHKSPQHLTNYGYLEHAVRFHNLEIISALLELHSEREEIQTMMEEIPFLALLVEHQYPFKVFTSLAKLWVQGKVKRLNTYNIQSDHKTPLHLSVIGRQREITKWLLDHGASENVYDALGKPPIVYALDTDTLLLFENCGLFDLYQGNTFWHFHFLLQHAPFPDSFLRHRKHLEVLCVPNKASQTPLEIAKSPEVTKIVKVCVQTGITHFGEHKNQEIADLFLETAARLNNPRAVFYILEENLQFSDDAKSDAMVHAIANSNMDIIRKLLSHGTKVTPVMLTMCDSSHRLYDLLFSQYVHSNFESDVEESLRRKAERAAAAMLDFEWKDVETTDNSCLQSPLGCPICLCDDEEDDEDQNVWLWLAPCGHSVHLSCMTSHLQTNGSNCPTCRALIEGKFV